MHPLSTTAYVPLYCTIDQQQQQQQQQQQNKL